MSYLDKVKRLAKEKGYGIAAAPTAAPQQEPVEREKSEESEISLFIPNAVTDNVLSRLQAGSKWLKAQHDAFLADSPDAASDERFSTAMAAWWEMERSLRLVFGYEGCIFGPDRRCPDDAPVTCNACMERE